MNYPKRIYTLRKSAPFLVLGLAPWSRSSSVTSRLAESHECIRAVQPELSTVLGSKPDGKSEGVRGRGKERGRGECVWQRENLNLFNPNYHLSTIFKNPLHLCHISSLNSDSKILALLGSLQLIFWPFIRVPQRLLIMPYWFTLQSSPWPSWGISETAITDRMGRFDWWITFCDGDIMMI